MKKVNRSSSLKPPIIREEYGAILFFNQFLVFFALSLPFKYYGYGLLGTPEPNGCRVSVISDLDTLTGWIGGERYSGAAVEVVAAISVGTKHIALKTFYKVMSWIKPIQKT